MLDVTLVLARAARVLSLVCSCAVRAEAPALTLVMTDRSNREVPDVGDKDHNRDTLH